MKSKRKTRVNKLRRQKPDDHKVRGGGKIFSMTYKTVWIIQCNIITKVFQ